MVLIGLIGCGILLPLIGISCYMLSSNKFAGPVMQETLMFYSHPSSKFCIKEAQSLVRIPESLMAALEFYLLHTPGDHLPSIDELRKAVLRSNPDLKDKPQFW